MAARNGADSPMLSGWAMFAAFMMVLVGAFQFFEGLVAVVRGAFYVVASNQVLVVNIHAWGWAHMILGVLLFFAGLSLFAGGMFGRVIGIIVALLSAFANLVFLPAYPFWAILVIVIDILIIYALTAGWGEGAY